MLHHRGYPPNHSIPSAPASETTAVINRAAISTERLGLEGGILFVNRLEWSKVLVRMAG